MAALAAPPMWRMRCFAAVALFMGAAAAQPPGPGTIACTPPRIDVVANATTLVVTLTYYTGDPTSQGRSPFVFATFSQADANAAVPWDPSVQALNPPTGVAFLFLTDPLAYTGMCDPAAATYTPFPRVENLTVWNSNALSPHLGAGNTSQQFAGLTPQLVGCTCPAAVTTDSGYTTPLSCTDGASYTDSPSERVFYGSPSSSGAAWAVRQSTCPTTGACGAADGGFQPDGASAACSIETQAQLVLGVSEALSMPNARSAQDASHTVLSWSLFTIEVASTSPPGLGVDSFSTRVLEHRYSVEYLTLGGVWTAMSPSGDTASLLLRVMSASAFRTNATAGTVTWHALMYSRSPTQLQSAVVQSVVTQRSANISCTTISLACETPGCVAVAQESLPSFLISRLTQVDEWVPYSAVLTCTIDFARASYLTLGSDWVLPTTTVTLAYELSVNGSTITDTQTPPVTQFEASLTLQGDAASSQSLATSVRSVVLSEASIAKAKSISDVIYANSDAASADSIAYAQAIAAYIDLAEAAPAAWQLSPDVAVLVATAQQPTVVQQNDVLAEGAVLNASWCGLDRTDVLGAFVFADGDTSSSLSVVTQGTQLFNIYIYLETVTSAPFCVLFAAGLRARLNSSLYGADLLGALEAVLSNVSGVVSASMVQGDISGDTPGVAYAVPDAVGGFAIPLRNKFVSSQLDGFYLSLCAVVSAHPASAFQLDGWSPLYYTSDAALANTMPDADGSTHDPARISGRFPVDLYMPWKPAPGVSLCAANLSTPGLPPGATTCSGGRRVLLSGTPAGSAAKRSYAPSAHVVRFSARTPAAGASTRESEAYASFWVVIMVLFLAAGTLSALYYCGAFDRRTGFGSKTGLLAKRGLKL